MRFGFTDNPILRREACPNRWSGCSPRRKLRAAGLPTWKLLPDGRFACLLCEAPPSSAPTDAADHYCGRCHIWHDDLAWWLAAIDEFTAGLRAGVRKDSAC